MFHAKSAPDQWMKTPCVWNLYSSNKFSKADKKDVFVLTQSDYLPLSGFCSEWRVFSVLFKLIASIDVKRPTNKVNRPLDNANLSWLMANYHTKHRIYTCTYIFTNITKYLHKSYIQSHTVGFSSIKSKPIYMWTHTRFHPELNRHLFEYLNRTIISRTELIIQYVKKEVVTAGNSIRAKGNQIPPDNLQFHLIYSDQSHSLIKRCRSKYDGHNSPSIISAQFQRRADGRNCTRVICFRAKNTGLATIVFVNNTNSIKHFCRR